MEKRLIIFLVLSSAIFMGWSYLYGKLYPQSAVTTSSPEAGATSTPVPGGEVAPSAAPSAASPVMGDLPVAPPTQVESRQIVIKTDHWRATLSNQGGVITDWVMTGFTDGKPIDPPNGVGLISTQLNSEIGSPLRLHLPSDPALEKELNTSKYEVREMMESEVALASGQTRTVQFYYAGQGVEATKTIVFRASGAPGSSGFDFDLQVEVKRNGAPVDAFVVVGPNFGDQKVGEVSVYKHAPQLTYAMGGSVERENAEGLSDTPVAPTEAPVTWAAVDDNYFAMAMIPSRPVPAIRLVNNQKYVSMAVGTIPGEKFIVYAGPKDLETLSAISDQLGLKSRGKGLEDIVSYGWLNFVSFLIKPIAQFMLLSMREINKLTQNFGWSIVLLTVILNMFFFPLRWKSSVTMKRAAAMQPKMKDLQERMKKLEKNDPRMLELQKEQIALMKEGNPLMGCLPLLLQMPFFMAVFAILTVSIEVRNAPFFGWLQDLSTPDPYWILPIMMCVTMIAQQALTPSTADPVQKKVGYVMPLIFTWFLKGAPAGLVLYWMVSNLVGVGQQFVINRLNPAPAVAVVTETPKSNKTKSRSGKS
jgi:YidC/Oxa1 family membrane protein insertase